MLWQRHPLVYIGENKLQYTNVRRSLRACMRFYFGIEYYYIRVVSVMSELLYTYIILILYSLEIALKKSISHNKSLAHHTKFLRVRSVYQTQRSAKRQEKKIA